MEDYMNTTDVDVSNKVSVGQPLERHNVQVVEEISYASDESTPTTPMEEVAPFESIHKKSTPTGEVPKTQADVYQENYIEPVRAGAWAAMGAGMFQMGRELNRTFETREFTLDVDYDPAEVIDELTEEQGAFTPEQVRLLSTAKSAPHMEYLLEYIEDDKMRKQAAADNPFWYGVGSFGDIDMLAGVLPLGAATKVGRVARGAAAALGTSAYYDVVGDGTLRTDSEQFWDAATMGLGTLVAPAMRGRATVTPKAGETTPPELPVYRETLKSVNKRWEEARAEVQANTKLTNEELSTLDGIKQGRGAAKRQLLADKKAQALAEVDAKFKPLAQDAANSPPRPLAALPDDLPPDAVKAAEEAYDDLMRIRTEDLGDPSPKKWIKNKWLASMLSSSDKMNHYLQGRPSVANFIYSAPHRRQKDIFSRVPVYENDYAYRLITVEDAMKDAVQVAIGRVGLSRFGGKYSNAAREVQAQFQQTMQRLDTRVLAYHSRTGEVPTREVMEDMLMQLGAEESVNKIARAYIDSKFATKAYDDIASRGWVTREIVDDATGEVKTINAMDDIVRRDTYLPVKQDYEQMYRTVQSGKATWAEMELFIGRQIARMYPDLLNPKNAEGTFVLTESQLGKHFIQTQYDVSRGLSDVAATGMNREQLTNLLTRSTGMSEKAARQSATAIYKEMHKTGTAAPSHLKRRIDWDWDIAMRTESGDTLSMRDIVSTDVLGNVEDYARTSAHRNAMADFGIMSEAQLENILQDVLDNVPKGTNISEAKEFLKGTKDLTMGRPVQNAALPPAVRGLQAVADLFALANSGLLSIMELATQLVKIGAIRNFKGSKQGLRAATTNLSKLTRGEAKSVEDILTGKLLAKSKWKSFHTRYGDDVAIAGGIAESAEYYGQAARFLNGSESIKRFQTGILAQTYIAELKGAMKGSKRSLKFMRKELEVEDALLSKIEKEYAKHGTDIDSWASGVRTEFEHKIYRSADQLAINIRKGELPAFMEQSSVGKAIFPYLSFVFAIQQKVLRRTINKDGYAGLAMLAAVQIPTAMMIASAINVRKGKAWDDDLLNGTIQAVSFLGALNYPMGIMMGGDIGSSSTAFIPLNSGFSLAGELGKGEDATLSGVVRNSPLNAALPAHIVAGVFDEFVK